MSVEFPPPVSYYARREAQERAQAQRATSAITQRIHRELAERYAALDRSRA